MVQTCLASCKAEMVLRSAADPMDRGLQDAPTTLMVVVTAMVTGLATERRVWLATRGVADI